LVLRVECAQMLENWRYNRAIEANGKQTEHDSRNIFLEEEYRTQLALAHLGIKAAATISEVSKVGSLLMSPELIPGLRTPYAVEVLGMPHSGKTTMVNRYLQELWQRNERNKVVLVKEGAGSIKEEHGDLRYSDPFGYTLLAGTAAFTGYISALKDINSGMRMVVSDRGQIDRRVWRRALFQRGDVNPEIMYGENQFIYDLENTPIQLGGIIMFMTKPETSIKRVGIEKMGPVTNGDFLSRLYEQYWRLHEEILQSEVPWRVYTCIDAEKDSEEVYERFKYAMDTTLNIHSTFLAALAKAFPQEFDRAKAEHDNTPRQQTHAQEVLSRRLGVKRVKIVGGDEMESEEDVLNKPFLEGIDLRNKH
jgi:hypothetical protein